MEKKKKVKVPQMPYSYIPNNNDIVSIPESYHSRLWPNFIFKWTNKTPFDPQKRAWIQSVFENFNNISSFHRMCLFFYIVDGLF